jgi:hypothetical protein
MDRTLINGRTYRDHLQEQGIDRLLICVKNPAQQGTRKNPNYPSVHDIHITQTRRTNALKGNRVDGKIQDVVKSVSAENL